jgi:hypothetical protein
LRRRAALCFKIFGAYVLSPYGKGHNKISRGLLGGEKHKETPYAERPWVDVRFGPIMPDKRLTNVHEMPYPTPSGIGVDVPREKRPQSRTDEGRSCIDGHWQRDFPSSEKVGH